MGVRFPSVFSTTFVGPLPANATETVICTTPPLTLPLDFAQVNLHWFFSILTGTGTTSLGYQIRRGTTTGGTALLGASQVQTIAAATNGLSGGCAVDTPGAVAGQQYSLTIVQTGATAAGAAGFVCLIAYAL